MDEREQLDQAREQLRNSAATAWNDLKNYGRAVVDHASAVHEQRKEQREFDRLEREREAEINARTEEHRKGMKEAFKEQDRLERQARRLQFKESVKQKASSMFAKLGRVKNELLRKLSPSNIDMKLRNAYEQAQLAGLAVANKGVQAINTAKENVTEFATDQAARYYNWQAEREEARLERERQEELRREEQAKEEEIKARTLEHKQGMKEAFKEQDRLERQARMLQFKEGVKQKTSSMFAKLGRVKNELLRKLSPSNIDMKLRNAYEQAQLAGLAVANKGVQAINTAKENVTEFATDQAARYYNWQAEREEARLEREIKEELRREEQAKEEELKARTLEHKQGMKEAFKEQDRLERQARMLQFKEGVKKKASSMFAKLGRVKNDALEKLNSAKAKVTDFTAEQAAKYYNWQAERDERRAEKDFQEAAKRAEKEELERIKARTRARKQDMIAALNSQEREMYEQRHLDNEARKQELLASLAEEKEKLFGPDIEYAENGRLARAR